jgi:hypothetical protein
LHKIEIYVFLRVTDFTAVVLDVCHMALLLSYLPELELCLAHLNGILDSQVGD